MFLHPFCKQTGGGSANSVRYFNLHLHRGIFFRFRKRGKEDSALPLVKNHSSRASYRPGSLGYTQKTPACPQNSSWAYLALKHECCHFYWHHLYSDLWPKKFIFSFQLHNNIYSYSVSTYTHTSSEVWGNWMLKGCRWNSNAMAGAGIQSQLSRIRCPWLTSAVRNYFGTWPWQVRGKHKEENKRVSLSFAPSSFLHSVGQMWF